MSLTHFDIEIAVFTYLDGTDVILPTDDEIGEQTYNWQQSVEHHRAELEGAEPDETPIIQNRLDIAQRALISMQGIREARDKALKTAQTLKFTVRKPTLIEVEDASAVADVFDEEAGIKRRDEIKYRRHLMGLCFQSEDTLPAVLESYVWQRLQKVLEGSVSRLPFFLSSPVSG